ncbi:hypothetical protein [Chitinimonas sp. BJB300]|uniref:hypothetical protein n=1 Tax=Chitinimonas sp. BJB300 TaxID=1559339 RepID=UPI000C0F5DAE|nr:hypothetical protein [Chitinimonas sp. BJB300]PHV11299.1 hypothetical protein CSQ89_11710 [Chitinimonas sp. BJB300]
MAFCVNCTLCADTGKKDNRKRKARRPPALNLKVQDVPVHGKQVPATFVSPIFRTYLESPPNLIEPVGATERKLLLVARSPVAPDDNENYLCLNREAGNATGGGVRWSLNDGFGLYVQGRNFKHLQRLLKNHRVTSICPPGDPNPICMAIPKQNCD